MLDEHAAITHAKAITGDQDLETVAIAFPRGTTRAQAVGAAGGGAIGGVLGAAGGSVTGGLASGTGLGGLATTIALERSEAYASIVLALGPKTLYLLGRHRLGPLASFANLEVIAKLPREEVSAKLERHGIVRNLTVIDSLTGKEFDYEVKPLGSGIAELLRDLESDADGGSA